VAREPAFAPRHFAPPLEELAVLSEAGFRDAFRASPVLRAKYAGFLRNVAIAMGNSGREKFLEPLGKLAEFPDELVAESARWAKERIVGSGWV
jgi:epoxyqueuosine reductase